MHGPWDDQHEGFSNVKKCHANCLGFQQGERVLKGKENWGNTEIEKEFTKFFNENISEWFDHIGGHTA